MEFAGVPPLLALLTPLEPVEALPDAPLDGDTLDVLLPDLEVPDPAKPVAERPTRSFERWLADERPVEVQVREREPREVFVPASVEVLVLEAQAGVDVPTSRPSHQIDDFSPDRGLIEAEVVSQTTSRPSRPATMPATQLNRPTFTASARPAHSALDLIRTPEMQAPVTLDAVVAEVEPDIEPDIAPPIERVVSEPRPTRRAPRPQARADVKPTPTAASPIEPDAPDRPIQARSEVVEAPVETEAPRPVIDTPAPLPQRVQVRIDEDLDVAIEADSEGIGVIVEGTAEAVEPLRDIADELADELARGGDQLTDFDARERGEDRQERAPSTGSSTASTADETTSTHDGLVEVIA